MKIVSKLEELERMMQNEEDVTQIHATFLSLVELPGVLEKSKPYKSEFLSKVVEKAMGSVGAQNFMGLQLVYLKKYGFCHGSFFVDMLPGTIFYLEDIKMGMLVFIKSLQDGEYVYVRFSNVDGEAGIYAMGKHSDLTH